METAWQPSRARLIRSVLESKATRASASAGSLKYWTRSSADTSFISYLSIFILAAF